MIKINDGYTHFYRDYGVLNRCTMVNEVPDTDGFVVVENQYGEYRIELYDNIVPIDETDLSDKIGCLD